VTNRESSPVFPRLPWVTKKHFVIISTLAFGSATFVISAWILWTSGIHAIPSWLIVLISHYLGGFVWSWIIWSYFNGSRQKFTLDKQSPRKDG